MSRKQIYANVKERNDTLRARYKSRWATGDPYADTSLKICNKCEFEFVRSEFWINRSSPDGLEYDCCSCSIKRQTKQRQKDPSWWLFSGAKYRARDRNMEFNITREDITIPKTCPVLGIPLTTGIGKLHHNSPTLDRIDSNKGYIKGNVRVISHRANTLKSNGTIEEFELILKDLKNVFANVE